MPTPSTHDSTLGQAAAAQAFIARWQGVTASELASAQSFVIDLCELLDVPRPHPTAEQDYMFERPITFAHGDGSSSAGRIDCYRRACFVLEAKKLRAGAHTRRFDDGLLRARAQAEGYARALPAPEGRPPFLIVVDVGQVIELYAEFSRSGATYTPFPDPRSHRIALADLTRPELRQRLRSLWLNPDGLNPALRSALVTRTVSELMARLARSIETGQPPQASRADLSQKQAAAHVTHACVAPELVASFLTRCLFSMFAEDIGLLPRGAFGRLLRTHRDDPPTLRLMLQSLWADMDRGGFSVALAQRVLHFNGKLFKHSAADGYSLLLAPAQIDLLIEAAEADWRDVEPAIFGTLLERALDPGERHALGAHYTPRAYVERLVLPAVIEPLRADWADAQAAALALVHEAAAFEGRAAETRMAQAREQIRAFHRSLCQMRVLDPACGSGNFLYVTLEHLKRLEGEVLNQLQTLGEAQARLGLEGETVTLRQLIGIELNPRAAAMAELVLWIGWLQWHIRALGSAAVAEPVVHDYGNIECRDAVLAWDTQTPALDASGRLLTRWDGLSYKPHPVTAEPVPDQAAQVPQWRYGGARAADWPAADFIVGNPPFIGNKRMREALGDGYVEALRAAWPQVPDSADLVMYWWAHAAARVATGQTRRMGLITTNSLRQVFNRRVVVAALEGRLHPPASEARSKLGSDHNFAQQNLCSDPNFPCTPQPPDPNFPSTPDSQRPTACAHVGVDGADALIGPNAPKSVASPGHPAAASASGPPDAPHQPTALIYAIADHPWVDSANGAAVRIAMTVLARVPAAAPARLQTVVAERPGEHGEVDVTLATQFGVVHADLKVGAAMTDARKLKAQSGLSVNGMMLAGRGFIVSHDDALALGLGHVAGLDAHIRPIVNGRDLTDQPRNLWVLDFFGFTAESLMQTYPAAYQWLFDRVKPERDQNNRPRLRAQWWLFGESRRTLRAALVGLDRYIVTVETAKHRVFIWAQACVVPEHKLVAIALSDAFHLGVLSSAVHVQWALAAGGRLGVGNDPVYSKSTCFDPFPFPDDDTGLRPEARRRIATLAEQIDAHRKRVLGLEPNRPATPVQLAQAAPDSIANQAAESPRSPTPHAAAQGSVAEQAPGPGRATAAAPLTLTGLYNVLSVRRAGQVLSAKDRLIDAQGLVGVLQSLHAELDAAVLAAYGWPDLGEGLARGPLTHACAGEPAPAFAAARAELLQRLVALNARRAAEESAGTVRWLRPAFQMPLSNEEQLTPVQQALSPDFACAQSPDAAAPVVDVTAGAGAPSAIAQPWPASLPEQVKAVAGALAASPTPLSVADLAARFKGRGPWKKSLPTLLQTLEALGRAHPVPQAQPPAWRG